MKRFLSAVCLCLALLISGLFFLQPKSEAQNDILPALLKLPAPPPPNPLAEIGRKNRSENFYSKTNPPGDDAPIEDLLDYWQYQSMTYNLLSYRPELKGKSLARVLGEIEKKPESLNSFLKALPESEDVADFVRKLYDQNSANEDFENDWQGEVKNWLIYHSKDYSGELEKFASEARESGEYVANQEPFLALARTDWDKAQPLVERLYNDSSQPVSQVLALWAYYRHALYTDSIGDIDKYRDELKAVVENKNATGGMRDLAFDALVREKEWDGLYDWYVTLLEDETLNEVKVGGSIYTGLTTLIYYNPPERFAERMIKLLKSDNQAVRNAVVRNLSKILTDGGDPEVARALLPWLENPKWAKDVDGERQTLVRALRNIALPESVPGLISLLDEKQRAFPTNSNAMVNRPMVNRRWSNSAVSEDDEDFYPYRREAVNALAMQKDPRAAPALRRLLSQADEYNIGEIVAALYWSNGFSISEQVEALEAKAKENAEQEIPAENITIGNGTVKMMPRIVDMDAILANSMKTANMMPYSNTRVKGNDPATIRMLLGNAVENNAEPSAALVMAVVDRIRDLERRDAKKAAALRAIVNGWKGPAVNSLMLSDLRTGKAELDSVLKLLGDRKNIREKQINEIYDARADGNRIAFGISACLLENSAEYEEILGGANAEIKAAMLACARLIRAPIPIQKVAENLKDKNELLALAAELYLESEDSPEAREIVLSLHPNEAKILGATTYFRPAKMVIAREENLIALFTSVHPALTDGEFLFDDQSDGSQYLLDTEEDLQEEAKKNADLLGVYAYDTNFVRIYKNKAVFSWEENVSRYRERDLTEEEFNDLKNYLSENRVYELAPFLSQCEECEEKELVMLGRQGGRRVFFKGERVPAFFAGLEERFEKLREAPAKLHYVLEKDIPGLEILFADDLLQARDVWKNGDDLRVLIEDPARRERIEKELRASNDADLETEGLTYMQRLNRKKARDEQRAFDHLSWFKFDKGKPSQLADQPLTHTFIPVRDNFPVAATPQQWKAKTANVEIRANAEGLYKITGGAFTTIREGAYSSPVLTPDGRWVIVRKYSTEVYDIVLVRVNLQTNKEFPLQLAETSTLFPVVFIPSANKVLLNNVYYSDYEDYDPEISDNYLLLSPETGVVEEVKGEVRPLAQQTSRQLQPTGAANEFWAAIPEEKETQVGTYNAKNLTFKPVLTIPRIRFNSMNMWIEGGKIYFVFEGHLLSLPLPKGG
jgi:hypothetical protein